MVSEHDQHGDRDLERLELPELQSLLDVVDDVRGLHEAANVAPGRPQRAGQAVRQARSPRRSVRALQVADRVRDASSVARQGQAADVLPAACRSRWPGQPSSENSPNRAGKSDRIP